METTLPSERRLLSTILETAGALIVVQDADGRVTRFNRACELTTGYSVAEIEGRHLWGVLMLDDEAGAFQAMLASIARDRRSHACETRLKTRLGTPRRIEWSSSVVLRPDDSIESIVSIGIDVTERHRLQKTLLEVSDQEARRIGQDLHDGLGQHLTGIAFMSKVLEEKLAERRLPETADADKIVRLVNEAINTTRELARGLLTVVSEGYGLANALRQIAADVEDLFQVSCQCACDEPLNVDDLAVATHLCHIARESVNNAIKHGRASHITLCLSTSSGSGVLSIHDDGIGLPMRSMNDAGMGLNIMRYRASMIGGSLQVEHVSPRGTAVRCLFPLARGASAAGCA